MYRKPVWLVTGIISLLFSCGDFLWVNPEYSQGVEVMLDQVKFVATFKTTPERLIITFNLVNNRDSEVYVIDRAFSISSQGVVIRPDHLTVTFDHEGRVVLSSKLPAFRPGMQLATPLTIYATPVHPRQSYTSQVSVLLPLRPEGWHVPRNQYGQILSEQISLDVCTRLLFELGVVPSKSNVVAPTTELAGTTVVQLGAQLASQQVVLAFEQSGLSIPCVK